VQNAKQATSKCNFCIAIVKEVELLLSANVTETKIEEILENDICPHFHGPPQQFCDKVAENIGQVVKYLEEKYSAKTVCDDLHFCHNGTK